MAPRKVKKVEKAVDHIHEGDEEGDAPTPTNEAMDSALNNFVIIKEIARYLDLEQLKRCRLVNKVWDELITIVMRKRAVIRFNPPTSTHLQTYLPSLKRWNVDFEAQIKFMKKLNFENIKLDLWQSRAPQVKEDMCWLLDNFGDQIKYLAVKMDVSSSRDGAQLSKILSHRLGSLIELKLAIGINWPTIVLLSPMESVRILKIYGIYLTTNGSDFMATLLSNPHNDAALSPFPNLTTLEIHDAILTSQCAIKFLQQLRTLPRLGLEHLVIRTLRCNQPVFDALREALERHAPTLQSLQIHWVDFRRGGNFHFTFPRFPKLKKLVLNIAEIIRDNDNGNDVATNIMTWRFPRGQVFYKDDFPLLEELRTGLVGKKLVSQNVLEAFVPTAEIHQNKCHTMKIINFFIPTDWEDQNDIMWIREFSKSFKKTFPNAILIARFW